jgi:hypothetical protein
VASASGGVRRVELGRPEAGRELPRRLAGRVALAVVEGLALPLAPPFRAEPLFLVERLVVLALVVLVVRLAPEVRELAGFRVVVLVRADRAEEPDDLAAVPVDLLAVLLAGLLAEVLREVLVRRAAGRAGAAAGLAVDMVLAAEVRALAAAVMALVALFMACIAVDMVLADVLALVAAAVILVAAEVTLVAAEETVRAAVAGVVAELERRAVLAERVVLVRRAVVPVERAEPVRDELLRAEVLRAEEDRPAALVLRADVRDRLAPVAVRPAERREALLLADRVLPELAGVRRAVARVVVCTGTDFPPS